MTTLDDISGRPGALVYIYEIVFNFFQGVGVLNRGDGKRGNRGFVEQSNATQRNQHMRVRGFHAE